MAMLDEKDARPDSASHEEPLKQKILQLKLANATVSAAYLTQLAHWIHRCLLDGPL